MKEGRVLAKKEAEHQARLSEIKFNNTNFKRLYAFFENREDLVEALILRHRKSRIALAAAITLAARFYANKTNTTDWECDFENIVWPEAQEAERKFRKEKNLDKKALKQKEK